MPRPCTNKYQNKMLPSVFETYFETPAHQHKTRFAKDNLALVMTSSAKDNSLLKCKGSKTWNGIPKNIRESASLKVFIKSYRNHLIGNYDPQSPAFAWDTLNVNKNSDYYYYY